MKVYIISDNSYFLLGIEDTIAKLENYKFRLINTNESMDYFFPAQGDIVIISIKNLHLREHIMRMPIIKKCRVMLMLSVPVRSSSRPHYPWLIRKDITVNGLIMFINKSRKISTCQDITSLKIKDVFQSLGRGVKIDEVSSNSMLSVKHLYQVKRNVIKRYGLYHCNSLGVLICRDIFYSSQYRD